MQIHKLNLEKGMKIKFRRLIIDFINKLSKRRNQKEQLGHNNQREFHINRISLTKTKIDFVRVKAIESN